jgi:very-short-patch-repair endonuclease
MPLPKSDFAAFWFRNRTNSLFGKEGREWSSEERIAKRIWAKNNNISARMHTPEIHTKISEAILKSWQNPDRLKKNLVKWTPEKRDAARARLQNLINTGKYSPMKSAVGWDPNSVSWLERKFLGILGECKLHGFKHNFPVEIVDEQNNLRKFWIDFAFNELMLGIEVDSAMFHSSYSQKAHDASRQELLEEAGWTIIRFTSKQILSEREATKSALKKAVEEAAVRKHLLPQ